MKNNLRRKIHAFLQSEDGKVGVKAPLALSVMSGSFLLAQVIFTSPVNANDGCGSDCTYCLEKCIKWGPRGCLQYSYECVDS